MTSKRNIGLTKLKVDLAGSGTMSRETLRYFIENRIDPYAPDVKAVRKMFQK